MSCWMADWPVGLYWRAQGWARLDWPYRGYLTYHYCYYWDECVTKDSGNDNETQVSTQNADVVVTDMTFLEVLRLLVLL